MVFRMQTYKALLQEKYPLPVEQFVIYLGSAPPKMRYRLEDLVEGENTNYAFNLINLREYAYPSLLTSDIPEEIMLAILGDFQNESPTKVVEQIVARLISASDDKTKLRRYARQLTILAGLRNLRGEAYQRLQTMAIETDIDITQDAWYIQGMEKEREKLIINLLKTTQLSTADIATAAEVSQQYVEELKTKHVSTL